MSFALGVHVKRQCAQKCLACFCCFHGVEKLKNDFCVSFPQLVASNLIKTATVTAGA